MPVEPFSKPSPKVITFGCRLNTYESEVMRNHAQLQELNNAIIINTCAVTNEAERQARQAIRKAKRENPNAFIIVTGCSAQINPDTYGTMPEVDRVLGNHEKMDFKSFQPQGITKVHVQDIMTVKETAHHLISGMEERVRAFIQIQNGCDHRCTFCTIPFGRGNNRSVPIGEIARQVELLNEQGCPEIVFTGVDITDYGKDLPGSPSLGHMMRRVFNHTPTLQRLRLSSVDPSELDEEAFYLISSESRIMPHIHISLQAGDDMILKRMKRRHLRTDVIDFCKKMRQARPDVVFGADIIAGFPTETEDMFANTIRLLEECDITFLHVFPYSAKKGTPAARMPQVSPTIIKNRAQQLRALGIHQQRKYFHSRVNHIETLLLETPLKGHTNYYAPVRLPQPYEGKALIQAKITGYTDTHLIGEPL